MRHKKTIVSLCAVTLLSVAGAAVGPNIAINADSVDNSAAQTTTTTPVGGDKGETGSPIMGQSEGTTTPEKTDTNKGSDSITTEDFDGTVNLVNDKGQVLGQTSELKGKIGDHVSITLPTGYVSATNGASTVDYVLNKDKTPIKIQKANEDKDVTRTIKITNPDGTVHTVTQVAKSDGDFDAYKVPEIKYYTPSVKEVPAASAKDEANKTVEVTYTKSLPDWSIGVEGYTVVSAGTITRTVNFVDESGKKVAPSKVESVKREILVKDSGVDTIYKDAAKDQKKTSDASATAKTDAATTKDATKPAKTVSATALSTSVNDKDDKAVSATATKPNSKEYMILEVDGDNTVIAAPAHRLSDIVAPKVDGMKVKDDKMATISGQYLWLSTPDTLASNDKLANGLDKFLTKDSVENVVYVKADAKDATKDNNKTDTKNDQTADANKDAATNNANSKDGNGSATGSVNQPATSSVVGGTSGAVLPQTGDKPNNWIILAIGSFLSAVGIFFADKFRSSKKHD